MYWFTLIGTVVKSSQGRKPLNIRYCSGNYWELLRNHARAKSPVNMWGKKKNIYLEEQTKVQAGHTVAGKPVSGDGKSLGETFSWITIEILVTCS